MREHTPTPWHSEEVRTSVGRCFKIGSPEMTKTDGKPSYVCVYDDWGHGDNVQSANAAFICKAVNSHDALVKALQRMTQTFKPFTMKPVGGEGSQARLEQQDQIEAHREALAALAEVQS